MSGALRHAALPIAAQWREWDAEFDEDKKSWKEIQAQIPPYPKPENLVQLKAGNVTSHRFYVDASSVSLGEDGVMRYTVVVKTTGGATNVTFEGMRCETRERKVYAIGHSDGTWVRARDPKWQRIELRELTPYYYVLYREYFCSGAHARPPPKQAVEALKAGRGFRHSRGAVTSPSSIEPMNRGSGLTSFVVHAGLRPIDNALRFSLWR